MATDMKSEDYVMLDEQPHKSSRCRTTCILTILIILLLATTCSISSYFIYRKYRKHTPSSSSIPSTKDTPQTTTSPTFQPTLEPTPFPTKITPIDYDIYIANRMAKFCLISYCIDGEKDVNTWDCSHCKTYYPKLTNVTVVETNWKDYDINAFVVYDDQYYNYKGNKQPSIVIAFEGTNPTSITDWIDDLDIFQTKYPLIDNCSDCYVHRGFQDAYSDFSEGLWNAVIYYRNVFGIDTPVQITGHSLGAGLAVFCALDGAITYGIEPQFVYTFGQPRVGNKKFAKHYNSWIPIHYRVTHSRDPVPHLPSKWMGTYDGYWHVATEVFYQSDSNGTYVVCDGSGEDGKCSGMYWADINVLDHLFYMGYDFATNYLTCW